METKTTSFRYSILFEDNYLMVIDKPAGLQVERDPHGNPSLEDEVNQYLRRTYPWKKQLVAGVVHRLDRPVSGVVVFAKTLLALKSLTSQFQKRLVRKFYLAVVEGTLPAESGELVHWLRKDQHHRRAIASTPADPHARECCLRYSLLSRAKDGRILLEIELLTGRYHQIRAQMSAIGCPVAGDEKYNSKIAGKKGIALHGHRLSLSHPKSSQTMDFVCPMPKGKFWTGFEKIS